MILLFCVFTAVLALKQSFNGTLNFINYNILKLTYPIDTDNYYGVVNNISYTITSVKNNYNGMFAMSIPQLYNVIGANNITGLYTFCDVKCDFYYDYDCPPVWRNPTYFEFFSYGPTNLTYSIEIDYYTKELEFSKGNLIPISIITTSIGACILIAIIYYTYRTIQLRKKENYQIV